MRIIAGSARGRRIAAPIGRDIRPTPDRVREALFSILGGSLDGLRVLDLFSGTGALGLEAASRGAAPVVLVERSPEGVTLCRQNITATRLEHVELLAMDVEVALPRLARMDRQFDIVLASPPYPLETVCSELLELLSDHPILADDGLIAIQHHRHQQAPDAHRGWNLSDRRRYGITMLSFYEVLQQVSPC